MTRFRKNSRGVTLIELLITVAIVAILAAIAYPSYQSQQQRARRTEGKVALLNLQIAEEKYFLANNQYGSLADLGLSTGTTMNTEHSYYQISFASQDATSFLAQATAQNAQASDTCANLTLSNTGAKTPSTGGCW